MRTHYGLFSVPLYVLSWTGGVMMSNATAGQKTEQNRRWDEWDNGSELCEQSFQHSKFLNHRGNNNLQQGVDTMITASGMGFTSFFGFQILKDMQPGMPCTIFRVSSIAVATGAVFVSLCGTFNFAKAWQDFRLAEQNLQWASFFSAKKNEENRTLCQKNDSKKRLL